MKKKKNKKRKQKKLMQLAEINTNKLNWDEITIGDYLEEEATKKLRLKVKYGSEQSLTLDELVKSNITIADIPEIAPEIKPKESYSESLPSNITNFKPILVTNSEIKETSSLLNNSLAEDEVAVTNQLETEDTMSHQVIQETMDVSESEISIDIESIAEMKKRELDEYLKEEERFKKFDKKLVQIARQPSQDTSSLFYRFVGKFFTQEANTL